MGIQTKDLKPFTKNDVENKQLVMQMLKYEEQLAKSDTGRELYGNLSNKPLVGLNVELILNRLTLAHFGFSSDNESVDFFRTIFKTYYKSHTAENGNIVIDYDADVINSSYYMRNNKQKFYKSRVLSIGEKIPDCVLYKPNGTDTVSLYDTICKTNAKYTFIGSFSLS